VIYCKGCLQIFIPSSGGQELQADPTSGDPDEQPAAAGGGGHGHYRERAVRPGGAADRSPGQVRVLRVHYPSSQGEYLYSSFTYYSAYNYVREKFSEEALPRWRSGLISMTNVM